MRIYGRYSWPTIVLSLLIVAALFKGIYTGGLDQKSLPGYAIGFTLWLFLVRMALAREFVEINAVDIRISYFICGITFTKIWNRDSIRHYNYDGNTMMVKMKSGNEYKISVKTLITKDKIDHFNNGGG